MGRLITALFVTIQVGGFAQAQEIIFRDRFETGTNGRWTSSVGADASLQWGPKLYIWEVDADTTGIDIDEFIELRNRSGAAIDFANEKYFVLLVNGSDDLTYGDAFQLTGTLPADGLYLIANLTQNSIQNGADGVLLVRCDLCQGIWDFPNDTEIGFGATFTTGTFVTATKIDGLAYDTDDSDDVELMAKVGVVEQLNENANGNKDSDSNSRASVSTWAAVDATPGEK